MPTLTILHPVISLVPSSNQGFTGKQKVAFLSGFARQALFRSAAISKIHLDRAEKNADGAPLPCNGVYWSISHKSSCVAGVVAPIPVGIDVERIRSVSPALYAKIATTEEWQQGGQEPELNLFFRYWTAKEAVLKAAGVGLKALSVCSIDQVSDDCLLKVRFENQIYMVTQKEVAGHLVSLVTNDLRVTWHMVDDLEVET